MQAQAARYTLSQEQQQQQQQQQQQCLNTPQCLQPLTATCSLHFALSIAA